MAPEEGLEQGAPIQLLIDKQIAREMEIQFFLKQKNFGQIIDTFTDRVTDSPRIGGTKKCTLFKNGAFSQIKGWNPSSGLSLGRIREGAEVVSRNISAMPPFLQQT